MKRFAISLVFGLVLFFINNTAFSQTPEELLAQAEKDPSQIKIIMCNVIQDDVIKSISAAMGWQKNDFHFCASTQLIINNQLYLTDGRYDNIALKATVDGMVDCAEIKLSSGAMSVEKFKNGSPYDAKFNELVCTEFDKYVNLAFEAFAADKDAVVTSDYYEAGYQEFRFILKEKPDSWTFRVIKNGEDIIFAQPSYEFHSEFRYILWDLRNKIRNRADAKTILGWRINQQIKKSIQAGL